MRLFPEDLTLAASLHTYVERRRHGCDLVWKDHHLVLYLYGIGAHHSLCLAA
jgi:hypothetical protein